MGLWRAPHATVYIDTSEQVNSGNTIIGESGVLTSFMTGATVITGSMKNISIVVPEGEAEQVNFLGITSGFQNSEFDAKPFGMAELTGTSILPQDELLMDSQGTPEHLFFGPKLAAPTSYGQYQAGSITTGVYDRPEITIVVSLAEGTKVVNIALQDALITKYGEVKIDDADGHWEFEIAIKALTKNFAMEWKN